MTSFIFLMVQARQCQEARSETITRWLSAGTVGGRSPLGLNSSPAELICPGLRYMGLLRAKWGQSWESQSSWLSYNSCNLEAFLPLIRGIWTLGKGHLGNQRMTSWSRPTGSHRQVSLRVVASGFIDTAGPSGRIPFSFKAEEGCIAHAPPFLTCSPGLLPPFA